MEIILGIITLCALALAIYSHTRASASEKEARDLGAENVALKARIEILNTPRALDDRTRSDLNEVLRPMRESVDAVRTKLEQQALTDARERHALAERVRDLDSLSRDLGNETRRLSDALKGNTRVQGQWGEHVLENILERAGLRKGEDFMVQASVRAENGTLLRPDVIIRYSEGRNIAVDAKTSISAYLEFCAATGDDERRRAGCAHLESVRKHVAELRNKSYQDCLGRENADFVLMFIPNEGAYMTALEMDPRLWESAFESRVIIISPTHLLSVLKLIEQIWRSEKQTRNVAEIARLAGNMLDKFSDFLKEMESIESALSKARRSYDSAMTKLDGQRGSLLSQAAKIKALGAKSRLCVPDDLDE